MTESAIDRRMAEKGGSMVEPLKKATLEDAWAAIKASEESRRKGEEEARRREEEAHRREEEARRSYEEAFLKSEEYRRKGEEALRKEQRKTERQIQALNKALDKANGNFNNKWGQFMENLLAGDLVKLLQQQGIEVNKISQRTKTERSDGTTLAEYDLLAVNTDTVVLIEMKTSLASHDVDRFLLKLERFKIVNPDHEDKALYGGLACLGIFDNSVKKYAQKEGLFLIQSPGGEKDLSTIVNSADFRPKEF